MRGLVVQCGINKQLLGMLLSLGLLFTIVISSTPSEEWNKTFETTYGSAIRSMRQTSDGGYILTGIAFMNWDGNGDTAAWLIKTDMNGNMQWNKMFPQEMPNAYSAQQTSDGGYIVAGMTYSNNGALIKTDADGNLQWNKTFGKSGIDSVRQTSDDGYIFFGGVAGPSGSVTEYALTKANKNGELQWNGTFGIGSAGGYDDKVRQTSDGGYIAVGVVYRRETLSDALLIKIDANGNLQWNRTFGGKDEDHAYSIRQTLDGGFIIGGSTESYNPYGESDAWLIKTDTDGNLQWDKTFGYGSILSVQQTSDGGYIFATGVQLIKTYTNGSVQWDKKISGGLVLQAWDGGYIIGRNQDWCRYGRCSFYSQLIKLSNESIKTQPTTMPTPTASVTQTVTTTLTPTATPTPSPTATPTLIPTSTHTPTPTLPPIPTSTANPTPVQCSNGCFYGDSCIPFGTRLGPQYSVVPFNGTASYCDAAKKAIEPQKADGVECQNNYECVSNYCSNGVCGNLQKELSATRGLLEQILDFLKRLFGKFYLK